MDVREFYKSLNIDPTEVLHRFGDNEQMLTKFLTKFLNDTTFVQLTQALEVKDWELVFRTAHTLKGLCGNFDFKELFELSAKIVERYRANDYDSIPEWFEKLKVCYQNTTNTLIKFLD
ncbi:MAG: Hpt domain-containing protein [Anaeroplasmataceae bacterium]|nr:Hpt domain-containing protein [Anaeroplasmataceae bacterium]